MELDIHTIIDLLRAGGSAVLVVLIYFASRVVKQIGVAFESLEKIEKHLYDLVELSRGGKIRRDRFQRPKEY